MHLLTIRRISISVKNLLLISRFNPQTRCKPQRDPSPHPIDLLLSRNILLLVSHPSHQTYIRPFKTTSAYCNETNTRVRWAADVLLLWSHFVNTKTSWAYRNNACNSPCNMHARVSHQPLLMLPLVSRINYYVAKSLVAGRLVSVDLYRAGGGGCDSIIPICFCFCCLL